MDIKTMTWNKKENQQKREGKWSVLHKKRQSTTTKNYAEEREQKPEAPAKQAPSRLIRLIR